MTDTADYDNAVKEATKYIDEWWKKIEKVNKQLAEVLDQMKKMDEMQKKQDAAAKEANAASKALNDKLWSLKIPPAADPNQLGKLPDVLTKHINKYGLRVTDTLSIKPDLDIDLKKKELKGGGVTVTITF